MQTAALLGPRSEEVLSGMVETYGMLGDVENSALWNERMLAVPGVMPLEGGVPIIVDGKIIGAIGVSGVTSEQDAQVAMAGAAAAK